MYISNSNQEAQIVISSMIYWKYTVTVECEIKLCCLHIQVRLEWPTDLTINPMDNSIYVLDNNVVLQITENRQVHTPQ